MELTFDGETTVQQRTCSDCGRPHVRVDAFLEADGEAYAIAIAALYDDDGPDGHHEREAWIDVIFRTHSELDADEVDSDRTTFGCRVGAIPGQPYPQVSAVQAASPYADDPLFGTKLDREAALAHPRIAEFWAVIDHLLVAEPTVHGHVYGPLAPALDATPGSAPEHTFDAVGRVSRWSRRRRHPRS